MTLSLLAVLLAYLVSRALRRVGINVSRERLIGIMVVFVIVALMLWGQSKA